MINILINMMVIQIKNNNMDKITNCSNNSYITIKKNNNNNMQKINIKNKLWNNIPNKFIKEKTRRINLKIRNNSNHIPIIKIIIFNNNFCNKKINR